MPAARRRVTPETLLQPDASETPPKTGPDTAPEAGAVNDAENDGDDDRETGPLRRCAVTRERLPKERMIRFVIGPDKTVVPDVAARLPGRGIWLSARGDVIESARTRGAFARAARTNVSVPPDLSSVLQAALARRVGDHLGLARRAGQAVAGYQKAREWLESGRAALIVQACDGSPDERTRFMAGRTDKVPVVSPLDGARLGAMFGRDHVVHVAVAGGRFAELLRSEAERLAGVMSHDGAGGATGSSRGSASKPRRDGAGGDAKLDGKGSGVAPGPDGVKAGK